MVKETLHRDGHIAENEILRELSGHRSKALSTKAKGFSLTDVHFYSDISQNYRHSFSRWQELKIRSSENVSTQ